MKNLHIHLVYLAIIGFLTYQYWTKAQALEEAVRSIEMFDKLLKANDLAVSSSLRMELDNYKEIFHSYQSGYINEVSNKIKYSSSTIDKISEWLEKQRTDFIQIAGGFDKNNTDVLAKRLETNPSKQFFTESKIHEFCDSLAHFQKVIESVNDSVTLKELQKRYLILELLHDSSYWMNLKNLTSAETLTQLSVLQNKVQLDKVSFIRYNLYSFTVRDIRFDQFKVAFAPQKAVLLEGDTFKTDIYLAAFSSRPGSGVTLIVNDKEIPFYEGVAHFENKENTTGLKTVKATAIVKNPLTGQVNTYLGQFEYEVLPKCAKNCQ